MSYRPTVYGPVGEMVYEQVCKNLGYEPRDQTEWANAKRDATDEEIRKELRREEKYGKRRVVNGGAGLSDRAAAGAALPAGVDPIVLAKALGEAASALGIPRLTTLLRRELQRSDLTPAQRAGLQAALQALGEHVAPGAKSEDQPATLKALVRQAVVDHLGREPLGKEEEVSVRRMIYKGNPGLMQAVLAEEKAGSDGE